MAVTQYIGSRYVPLFADPIEWSSSNTYEPLTIVLHEGNSYTSKQAVPKGIAIDNEAFWALTGNYNAQIEVYRRETAAAKAAADDAQADIDTLLPKTDFSAENTVKDYVDDIGALLPKSAFSSEHTVKEYVDDLEERITIDIAGLPPARYLIQPVVIGNDYMPQDSYDSNGVQFAACVKHDSTVYGIFTKNSSTGACVTRLYNIITNTARTIDTVSNGHANSMCYIDSTDKILCVWLNQLVSGSYVDTNKVNVYDAAFNLESTIELARPYYGVSYDSVNDKLYAMSHERMANHIIVIYELDTSTYAEISSFELTLPTRYHGYTLQDFAVNDGLFYINFSQNFMWVHGEGVDEHHIIDTEDVAHQYDVGESEGLEFDNRGNLINAFTFTLNGVDGGAAGSVGVLFNNDIAPTVPVVSTSRTLTLSEDAKNQFYIYPWVIRNIAEINNHIDPTWHIVRVDSDVDNLNYHAINILKPFNLFVTNGATFKVSPFIINDDVTVHVDNGATLQFVIDTNPSTGQLYGTIPFTVEWGSLCINNRGHVASNNTTGTVLLGYNKRPFIMGNNANNDVKLFAIAGAVVASANTMYMGDAWYISAQQRQ